jgi:hypothetical protein
MNLNYKGLMNILGLQPLFDRVATLESSVESLSNAPSTADGNGIYGGSGNIPNSTLASTTQSLLTDNFAIGNFPNWPNANSVNSVNKGILFSKDNSLEFQYIHSQLSLTEDSIFLGVNNPVTQIIIDGNNGIQMFDGFDTTTITGNSIKLGFINATISSGEGAPNGVRTGNPGDMYLRIDGGAGTSLYVKETGIGTNTGWVGK